MSREQWGHGYHQGYQAAMRGGKEYEYVLPLDSQGFVKHIGIVREIHENRLVVEWYDDPLHHLYMFNKCWPFDPKIVAYENFEELDVKDIEPFKLFKSQAAMLSFCASDWSRWALTHLQNRKD